MRSPDPIKWGYDAPSHHYQANPFVIQPLCLMSHPKELHVAAANGDLTKVVSLIMNHHCSAMYRDENGNTALHYAAGYGHLHVIQYLTAIDTANPTDPGQDEMTPLHIASEFGHLHVVHYLINEQKVDPWCYDNKKQTPLYMACKYGHLEVAKFLVQILLIYMKLEDMQVKKMFTIQMYFISLA